jgi:hypothetical protein
MIFEVSGYLYIFRDNRTIESSASGTDGFYILGKCPFLTSDAKDIIPNPQKLRQKHKKIAMISSKTGPKRPKT